MSVLVVDIRFYLFIYFTLNIVSVLVSTVSSISELIKSVTHGTNRLFLIRRLTNSVSVPYFRFTTEQIEAI